MKKYILLLLTALAVAANALARQDSLPQQPSLPGLPPLSGPSVLAGERGLPAAAADTVVFCRPDTVVVVHSDTLLAVTVNGKAGNPAFTYERRLAVADTSEVVRKESVTQPDNIRFGFDGSLFDFGKVEREKRATFEVRFPVAVEAGFSVPFARPSAMKTKFFRCNEWRLDLFQFRFTPKKGKWWLTFDWGLSYHRFIMRENAFVGDADHHLSIAPLPPDAHKPKSCMAFLKSDFKMLFHYPAGKKGSFAAGLMVSKCAAEFGNYCSTVWRDADGKELSETYRIKPRRVTTSVRAEYTAWRFVKVYLDVAPYSPFKSGTGPQFGTVSFGGGLRF